MDKLVSRGVQIDIGFEDIIVPGPSKFVYPALLDFPSPELNSYTMESTIAEKFQAMVKLGILNSRMKDFYNIWFLSRTFDFRGETLAEVKINPEDLKNGEWEDSESVSGSKTDFRKANFEIYIKKRFFRRIENLGRNVDSSITH